MLSAVANNTLDTMILPIIILNVVIKLSTIVVQSHSCFRSCIDLNKQFYDIFPGSKIAQKFQLGKAKCAYLVNNGMLPFVKNIKNTLTSPFYIVNFDESINE